MANEFKNVELPYYLEIPGGYGLKDGIDIAIKGEMKNVVANQGFAIALGTTKSMNLSSPTGIIPLIFEVDLMKKEVFLKTFGQKSLPSGCDRDPLGLAILKKDCLTKWLPLQKHSDGFEITLRATEACLQVWIDGVMFAAVTLTHLCPLEHITFLHISDVKSGGALKIHSVIFKKVPSTFPATEGGMTFESKTPIQSI